MHQKSINFKDEINSGELMLALGRANEVVLLAMVGWIDKPRVCPREETRPYMKEIGENRIDDEG